MNYLEELSDAIRREVPDDKVPEGDVDCLFLLYAVLLLARGEDVGSEDVHNAWAAWMTCRGEAHRSLVPYENLPEETRAEDATFVEAIRNVAVRQAAKKRLL